MVDSSSINPDFVDSICYADPQSQAKADKLSQQLACPLVTDKSSAHQLLVKNDQLYLAIAELGNPIGIDFCSGKNDHRRKFGGGKGQPLAKAVGLKSSQTPNVIDATAGFARDAFVLATLGCNVQMLEQNPFLAILIEDAIEHALQHNDIGDIARRMKITHCHAQDYIAQLTDDNCPDVIYMDPMYPSRDKSALVKKEMQLLHHMIGPDTDSAELLDISRSKAKKRVVVKRPKGAEYVGNCKPSTSIESKNTRYDIYVTL